MDPVKPKCPHGHCFSCMICFMELRGKKLHSGECNHECGCGKEGCECPNCEKKNQDGGNK